MPRVPGAAAALALSIALAVAVAAPAPAARRGREAADPATRARQALAHLQRFGLPVLIQAPDEGRLTLRAGPSEGTRVVYRGPAEPAVCGGREAASLRRIRLTGMVPGWYRVRVAGRLGWLPAASVVPVERLERRTLDGQLVAALPINDAIETAGRSSDGSLVYLRYRDPGPPQREGWLALHVGRGDYFRLPPADTIRELARRETLAVRLAGPAAASAGRRAAAGDRLYVVRGGAEPALLVADLETGRLLRTYPLPAAGASASGGRDGTAGPDTLLLVGETLLAAGQDYPTIALDLASGEARRLGGPGRLLRVSPRSVALLPSDRGEPLLRYEPETDALTPLETALVRGALVEPPGRLATGSGAAGLLVVVRQGC